jgi:hypothetical protein
MTFGNMCANGRLTFKRASAHCSGGPWDDDDYDMFDGTRNVGRIMLHPHAPRSALVLDRLAVPAKAEERGYSATREEAMAEFKAAWHRAGPQRL